jgi:cysteinyl-tRNA synthetase
MDAIVKQIEAIIATGSAYAAEGHVLFDVSSIPPMAVCRAGTWTT